MNEKHFGMRYTDSLAHHGILGQKWGIRRYQNPDGSLTPEGKLRYASKFFANKKNVALKDRDPVNHEYVKHGVFKDHLKAGTKIVRYSGKARESVNDIRKYASVEKGDEAVYKDIAMNGGIGAKKGQPLYKNTYTLTKNIKIAKPEHVLKDIVNEYGSDEMKSRYRAFNKMKIRDRYFTLNKLYDDPKNKWIFDYAQKEKMELAKDIYNIMYDKNKSNAIFNKYKRKGYAAIGDPEDYVYGFEYPMIIIDPANTMKLSSSRRII